MFRRGSFLLLLHRPQDALTMSVRWSRISYGYDDIHFNVSLCPPLVALKTRMPLGRQNIPTLQFYISRRCGVSPVLVLRFSAPSDDAPLCGPVNPVCRSGWTIHLFFSGSPYLSPTTTFVSMTSYPTSPDCPLSSYNVLSGRELYPQRDVSLIQYLFIVHLARQSRRR